MADCRSMTTEEFDWYLRQCIDQTYEKPSDLLSVGDVYNTMAEELNNEVIKLWEEDQNTEEKDG